MGYGITNTKYRYHEIPNIENVLLCKGEKGSSIAFRVHLNEKDAETELRVLMQEK